MNGVGFQFSLLPPFSPVEESLRAFLHHAMISEIQTGLSRGTRSVINGHGRTNRSRQQPPRSCVRLSLVGWPFCLRSGLPVGGCA